MVQDKSHSTSNSSKKEAGAFSPLRHTAFRGLWIATVISNIGHWMHEVGAAWLMTDLSDSPFMVAMVQTSLTLPFFFFALPAGVLTDLLDRRKYLLSIQILGALAAGGLAVIGITGGYTPSLLLAFSFLLGLTTAMTAPAWQAVVAELVPRSELPSAVALNGMGINVARAIGPAAAGFLVAASGPTLVFALNSVSFVYITWVLWRWKRQAIEKKLPPEHFWGAVITGIRFIWHAPPFRAVLWRIGSFMISASAVWALLPLVAREELKLTAAEYGFMLAALGAGAIVLASQVTRMKAHLSSKQIITLGTLSWMAVTLALAYLREFYALLPLMFAAGAAWLALLSTLNVGAQATLPAWVRGRALSVYLLVFFGGMAIGSMLWGAVATVVGIQYTLIIAVGLQLFAWMTTHSLPLSDGKKDDLKASQHWPLPSFTIEKESDNQPLLLRKTYRIAAENFSAFSNEAEKLRSIRLRDGATNWGLYSDENDPKLIHEIFIHASLVDHLRSHERFTEADKIVEAKILAFHIDKSPPKVEHFRSLK